MNLKKYIDKENCVLLVCFLTFTFKLFNHTSFYSFLNNPIFYPSIDNTYWLFFITGLPKFIAKSAITSLFLDLLLCFTPLLLIFYKHRGLAFSYLLLIITYLLYFNSVTFHHYHDLISIVFLLLPLLVMQREKKILIWDLIRYYFLFAMTSAGLWKLCRGSFFELNHMKLILNEQHLTPIFENTDSLFATITSFINLHPMFGWILFSLATLIELSFIIGFFTKKYDFTLLIILLIFCGLNFIILGINSFVFCLFGITLIQKKDSLSKIPPNSI